MKRRLFIIFAFCCLVSCKQEKNTGTPAPDTEREVQTQESYNRTPEDEPQFIENDSLTQAWIAELEMMSTAEERFRVNEELRENRHVEKQIDTVKTLYRDESTLTIYTTTGLYALQSAEIRDPELALNNAVKVGMSRNELEQVLETELESDVVEVGTPTRNMHFTFYFEDDRVNRITFHGYVD